MAQDRVQCRDVFVNALLQSGVEKFMDYTQIPDTPYEFKNK